MQRESCNLLYYPWIPVKTLSGELKSVGIMECLERANTYKDVVTVNYGEKRILSLLEFARLRFLINFVMDAYREELDNPANLVDIINDGEIDMNLIKQYVETCEKEGCSFDIFDLEKPFLQTDLKTMKKVLDLNENESTDKTIEEITKAKKTVGNMNPLFPCGGNQIFSRRIDAEEYAEFYGLESPNGILDDLWKKGGAPEDIHYLTYAEYASYLVYNHIMLVFCGEPSSSSLSVTDGCPPIYSLLKGENLFQTIMLNCSCFDNENKAKPMWRWDNYLYYCDGVRSVGESKDCVLTGLLFPSRFMYPVDFANEKVQTMYYSGMVTYLKTNVFTQEGRKKWWESERELWKKTEPHVSYRKIVKTDKKNNTETVRYPSITLNNAQYAWLELADFINYSDTILGNKTMKQFAGLMDDIDADKEKFHLCMYYTITNQSEYRAAGKIDYDINKKFLSDRDVYGKMKLVIETIRVSGEELRSAVRGYTKECVSKQFSVKAGNTVANTIMLNYYNNAKIIFLNEYMEKIGETNDTEKLTSDYIDLFKRMAVDAYDKMYARPKTLLIYSTWKGKLLGKLYRKEKKDGTRK